MSADFLGLAERVKANALIALEQGALVVAERARDLAPVSHEVNPTRRVRFKTRAEVVADRDARRRLGLGREYIAAARTRIGSRRGANKATISVENRSVSRMRLMERPNSPRQGGRLRDEIRVTPVEGEGGKFQVMVVSPTPYAKFQEYGTRRNPASPFLRPALHESRGMVVASVRSAVRSAIKGKPLEIRVRE